MVKLTASKVGAALGLSDDAEGGAQIFARDTGNFVKVVGRDGSEKVVEP